MALAVCPSDDLGGAACVLADHETEWLSFSDGGAVSTTPPSECRARSARAWDTGVVLCLPCILWRLSLIWQCGLEKCYTGSPWWICNCQPWAVRRGSCEVFMWENPQFHLRLADVCSVAVIPPGLFLLTVIPFNLPLLWNFIPQMFSKLSCVFDLYELPSSKPFLFHIEIELVHLLVVYFHLFFVLIMWCDVVSSVISRDGNNYRRWLTKLSLSLLVEWQTSPSEDSAEFW